MVTVKRFAAEQDWSDLKPDLLLVLAKLRGAAVSMQDAERAEARIQERCRLTAEYLLKKWHIRQYEFEGKEAVQQWNVLMYSSVFARCDEAKEVHAFAYRVLRRCCTAIVRAQARNRLEPQLDEPLHEKDEMLDAMIGTEELTRVMHAVTLLPSSLNWAVRQWLAHRELKLKMRFASREEQHQFHNRMYRARKRIRQILKGDRPQKGTRKNSSRAA